MMKERWLKGVVFVLTFVCAGAFCLYLTANAQVKKEQNALNAVYQRALYEANEMLSGMQITMKKLTVTNSRSMEIEYLSDISRQAQSIWENLSSLPGGGETVVETIRFVNQAGDFADSVLKRLAAGGAVTNEDRKNIESMLASVTQLTLDANRLITEYLEGEKVFSGQASYSGEETLFQKPAKEYPKLLYDGPFSESAGDGKLKGLTGEEVTREQAQKSLSDFFDGEAYDIKFLSVTGGDTQLYEFSLKIGNTKAYAAVTRKGGRVLYVLPEYGKFNELTDAKTLMRDAEEFLFRKGYGEFRAAHYRKYDGVLTVNLAPIENNVILYPDLIKLEMNMETGKVIGIECTNYYKNHVKRNLPAPEFTAQDIKSRIGESAYADNVRLCVIPYNAGERFVWESHVLSGRDEFLIYSDADTGEEILIYQLVHMPDGTIVQ